MTRQVSLLALAAALTAAAPQAADAADECGVGAAVTCTGGSYLTGITYTTASGMTLTLDNPNMVVQNPGFAGVSLSGTSTDNVVVNAVRFQSITSPGTIGLQVNNTSSGSALLTMDSGSVVSGIGGNFGAVRANSSLGTAQATLNGGSVSNTSATGAAVVASSSTGSATVLMTGGTVTAAGRGLLANPGFNAVAPMIAIMNGGSVQAGGDGVSSTAARGSATTIMSGGTVTSGANALVATISGGLGVITTDATVSMQTGTVVSTGTGGSGIFARNTGSGRSIVQMSGGTVSATGNNADGIFVNNGASSAYAVTMSGGSLSGGAGNGAAIHTSAASGGTLSIGVGAVIDGSGSGVAIRDGDLNRDGVDEIGGAMSITTAGTLHGAVLLGLGNDVLSVTGGAINGNITGGGAANLTFNLGTGSFLYGTPYAVSGINNLVVGSGVVQLDGTSASNTIDVAGTLILNNATTVAAGTTVRAGGLLQIGTGGASGALTGNVVSEGTLAFARSDSYAFGGDITGSGAVNQLGTGTLILSGNNAFTGGINVFAGSVQAGAANSLGSGLLFVDTDGATNLAGFDQSVSGLSGAGQVLLGGATLTSNQAVNTAFSGVISGAGALVKDGAGTLILSGNNTYTGGTTVAAGTLQVGSGGTSGAIAGDVANNGTLAFNRSDTLAFGGTISGNGSIRQAGTGRTNLTGDSSTFTGTTSVQGGTLAVNGSLCGDMNVLAGGRLQGTGTVCDTTNFAGGTVGPGNSIGTITVAGNYVGNGGLLEIETVLGGDASPTDRLVVTGDTAGSTNVRVINVRGAGARTVEGIKIVDVGGVSNGAFSLLGDYVLSGQQAVVGGAYAYTLQQHGVSTPNDGDWYLRSSLAAPAVTPGASPPPPPAPPPGPLYQPGVPLYETYAQLLLGMNEMPTLMQRRGSLDRGAMGAMAQAGPAASAVTTTVLSPVWGRFEGRRANHNHATTALSTFDADHWKFEGGLDAGTLENAYGKLIFGVTAHYQEGSADVFSFFGNGTIRTTGGGVGGTATWYGDDGLYVDSQARASWYGSNLTSALTGPMARGNDGFGYALSTEGGRRFAIGEGWSLTPQLQATYANVSFDTFTDRFGAVVSLGQADSLLGRAGLSLDHRHAWRDGSGQLMRSDIYGIANLFYEFLDGSSVDVSGTRFANSGDRLWGGIGAGGTFSWNNDRYALYGEVSYNTSLEDLGTSTSYKGTAGFRLRW